MNVAATTTTATTTSTSTTSKGRSQPVGAPAGSVSIAEVEYVANCELDKEDWFHGPIPRKQSEELVIRDGDFLVHESKGSSGSGEQYVLTGMQSGTHKHLLLVDPEGVVSLEESKTCVGLHSQLTLTFLLLLLLNRFAPKTRHLSQ